ncbi:MAG: hypothetical protein GWN01_16490 [Nitrosopumilaceae archaeon]|nr:hypothetical protein [Nitrosopumilaceae archaeon]NIU87380.1 hypothetical protein [Nitrosopumilaceae archaeon]NIX63033.1 hypothetical protein [Nitrosopumilaceae archaeon]
MDDKVIYQYKKINLLPKLASANSGMNDQPKIDLYMILYNKINELVIEYNHLARDLELYKKQLKNLYTSNNTG